MARHASDTTNGPATGFGDWACDISVALPALVSGHSAHVACRHVVVDRSPALAGHAVVQLYTALTRLPLPDRVKPEVALRIVEQAFPNWLDRQRSTADILRALASSGLGGPAVIDGLVGLSSAYVGATILTRNGRAIRVYEALNVPFEVVA
jgi:toxin FitB